MAEYIEREVVKRVVVGAVDSGLATTSEDLAEVIGEIPAGAAPEKKWIPVEEALPTGSDGVNHSESAIAYTVEGEVCPGWMRGDTWYLLLKRDNVHTKHGRGYVTHWMPLPEPPEDEGAAVAILEAKNELLAQENDRLKAEIQRLHWENFWLTGAGGASPSPTEVRKA